MTSLRARHYGRNPQAASAWPLSIQERECKLAIGEGGTAPHPRPLSMRWTGENGNNND